MLAALLSSVANAGGLVLDKIILSRRKLSLGAFLALGFALLFVFDAVLLPKYGHVNWQVATLSNELFLLFLMIIIAIAWNVLYYQSVQLEKVHHTELIMMLQPLITVILAAVFYPETFDARIFILAIVASVALLFSKSQKEHFFSGRVSYNTFLAVVLMSTETIIIRELLFFWSPVALYAVRTLAISVFFFVYYRPKLKQVRATHWWPLIGSTIFGLVTMLGKFYAFQSLGIIYTTLITILGPIIVFLASWELLHEKIRWRMVAASLVILACLVTATVLTLH